MEPCLRLNGLLVRRYRWGLSGLGWLILALLVLGTGSVVLLGLNGFLAVNSPTTSSALVMEGWVHGTGVARTVTEFHEGHYQLLITTGGPMPSDRTDTGPTWAESGAYWLRRSGVKPEAITICSARETARDRTYTSAQALKQWLTQNAPEVRAINVVSEDVHARRTRLLFQKALGSTFQVGIIAARNPDYESKRWWYYSEGVRETLGETIAYLYVRCFFWP